MPTRLEWSDYERFPADHGVILIAPETRGLPYEWDTFDGAGSPDLVFFDDMLSCLASQYSVDMSRIYASGMSAGGLWAVTLSNHRSEGLAATAPLSGGATEVDWNATDKIPMLLTWGGPNNLYGNFSFDEANYPLDGAGHFTVKREHDDAHTLPPGGLEYAWEFFEAHPRGTDPEPWADALPSSLPEWCRL
ncbi:MAG: polyhydroxybutyrate depolymerase [Myxococcota bacterium]|jgi:polyhydroxybutyrate depolymerase